ncbi:MAG: hypothetical protein JF888_02495 [Candidatus Dormibacteraeota bacterium]|uniref:Uncharacterized protein n=1 Tax=Candidatus Dormiibacter inghamiae TaxID=3127013 RepID=A0A934KEA2_9BACT|nr:hypothetical protein [Candidatus Dormibacteraeota bacterium]MBJ7605450.1 hypothetical protein [Candidatus Dormibacteraeota bacterium]
MAPPSYVGFDEAAPSGHRSPAHTAHVLLYPVGIEPGSYTVVVVMINPRHQVTIEFCVP